MINISKLSSNIKKLKEIADHCRLTKKSEDGQLKVKQYFDEKKLYTKSVPKDSNNLYRAISDALYFTQSRYAFIKLSLVEFIESAPNQLSLLTEAFCEMDINEYISNLRKGPIEPMFELLLLCERFNKNLNLIYAECRQQNWEVKDRFIDLGFKKEESINIFLSLDGSFDSVYDLTFIQDAGICQSLLYDIFDQALLQEGESMSPNEHQFSKYQNIEYLNWKSLEESKRNKSNLENRKKFIQEGNRTMDITNDKLNDDFFNDLLKEKVTQNTDDKRKAFRPSNSLDVDKSSFKPTQTPIFRPPTSKISLPTTGTTQAFHFSQNPLASPPPGFTTAIFNPRTKNIDTQKMQFAGIFSQPTQKPTTQEAEKIRYPPKAKHVSDTFITFGLDKHLPKHTIATKDANDSYSNGSSLNVSHEAHDASPSGRPSTPPMEHGDQPYTSSDKLQDFRLKPFPTNEGTFVPNTERSKEFSAALKSGDDSPKKKALSQQLLDNFRRFSLTGTSSTQPMHQQTQQSYISQQPLLSQLQSMQPMPNQQMFMPYSMVRNQPHSTTALPTHLYSQPQGQFGMNKMSAGGMGFGQQQSHPTQNNMNAPGQQQLGAVAGSKATGKLKFFDENQNYGFFVQDSDGSDLFVHYDDLRKANVNKELLRKAKSGYTLKFTYIPMSYYGKYSLSKKAIDIELTSIDPIYPQQSQVSQPQGQVHTQEQAVHHL